MWMIGICRGTYRDGWQSIYSARRERLSRVVMAQQTCPNRALKRFACPPATDISGNSVPAAHGRFPRISTAAGSPELLIGEL
jgi:hypothetical protein